VSSLTSRCHWCCGSGISQGAHAARSPGKAVEQGLPYLILDGTLISSDWCADKNTSKKGKETLLRYQGERGFALMSQRWHAIQHVSLSPTTIGDIVKSTLVTHAIRAPDDQLKVTEKTSMCGELRSSASVPAGVGGGTAANHGGNVITPAA
jgi:hypothetical protein